MPMSGISGGDPWGILINAFRQIALDFVVYIPRILVMLIIFIIAFFFIKILNIAFRKLLKLAELDRIIGKLAGFAFPFSMNSLLILLLDVGIALIAVYVVSGLFLDSQQILLVTEGLRYGARIVSVVVVSIFLFSIFGVVIDKIRIESMSRGYIWFITFLIITAMLMDITALTDPVKNSLISGLSMGVGISLGVFALWFFFHDYLDRIIGKIGKPEAEKK
ncbi:MAG: hypothetical protein QG670_296 [Thermoproteota archaeon]|nr:hypothetical protein [Thermoproteota archaeon]